MDAEHWFDNLRRTVLFERAIEQLLREGRRTFVEVSPHPVLHLRHRADHRGRLGRVRAGGRNPDPSARGEGGPARFLTSLAAGVRAGHGGGMGGGVRRCGAAPGSPPHLRLPARAPLDRLRVRRRERGARAGARDEGRACARRRARAGREPAAGSFAARIAALPEQDRHNAVLDEVLAQVAVVLGHSSTGEIDPRRTFKELGFDSLSAVELRNRLRRDRA